MGRPPKHGVDLHTRVPEATLRGLQLDAAEKGGSLGDAVQRLWEGRAENSLLVDQLRQDVKAARIAERAALEVARRSKSQVDALTGRLARVEARTKAAMRRDGTWP